VAAFIEVAYALAMALPATIVRLNINLSDVDRGVYDTLELRLARHPSETERYMVARAIAYALSVEEGIAFSKGGLSATDEAPISIHDATGRMTAWIDVGNPSGARLHKAAKLASRVSVYTWSDLVALKKEAPSLHRAEEIEIAFLPAGFLDQLAGVIDRRAEMELLHTGGQLYVTVGGQTFETPLVRTPLLARD
jgi:uncharacterized protein YaeQ